MEDVGEDEEEQDSHQNKKNYNEGHEKVFCPVVDLLGLSSVDVRGRRSWVNQWFLPLPVQHDVHRSHFLFTNLLLLSKIQTIETSRPRNEFIRNTRCKKLRCHETNT